jgi:serine/threonine protein kinase
MPTAAHQIEVGEITSVTFCGNEKFAIRKIIEGGMGIVYQLIPIRAGAPPCALKTLQGVMTVRAFERECDAWLSVSQHPHIAHAFAYGHWQGAPAILVDWYPRSMAQLKVTECNDDYLIELVGGIVAALDFSYTTAGLIHQDIKPSNILIDTHGAPRLADFGLARCVKHDGSEALPQRRQWHATTSLVKITDATSGTPFYMAPELFGGASASITTDLFSLGVTLFQFLTGEHPYFSGRVDAKAPLRLRHEILARFISTRGPQLARLSELICKCLALDARDRPNSYGATGWLEKQSGFRAHNWEHSLPGISAAIAQAGFHRERGDFAKCSEGPGQLRPLPIGAGFLFEEDQVTRECFQRRLLGFAV